MSTGDLARWMAAAVALGERGAGRTGANPNVGCIVERDGVVLGRGWTQPGGRPHAEAMALAQAGDQSRGATIHVTLEPCAHQSARGPACADLILAAQPAHVSVALVDPDPRTAGQGIARLRAAGIEVSVGATADRAARSMAGFLTRQRSVRPHVTLKLALSLDGCIALADGSSRWITGAAARRHAHLVRARSDAILVGGATLRTDAPALDVRLAGLEDRAPHRVVLTGRAAPPRWQAIAAPEDVSALDGNWLLVEGGAQTAAAFLCADLIDRLMLYRAPILIGGGTASLGDIGLTDLATAHGRWRLISDAWLGSDRVEVYDAIAPQEV